MTGLAHPLPSLSITQPFGHLGLVQEPAGWLETDAAGHPRRYRAVQSSPYIAGEAVTYHQHVHPGTDYGCPIGTNVLAVERGVIVAAGTYASTGEHYVMVRFHRDGQWQTLAFYTHLSRILVPVGDYVARGQHIAESGASGNVTGPHLHFEVRRGASDDDPHLSGSSGWGRWSPGRCYVGGDMAGASWLAPS